MRGKSKQNPLLGTKVDYLLIDLGQRDVRPISGLSIERAVRRLSSLRGNLGTWVNHLWHVVQRRKHAVEEGKGGPTRRVLLRGRISNPYGHRVTSLLKACSYVGGTRWHGLDALGRSGGAEGPVLSGNPWRPFEGLQGPFNDE